MSSVPAATIVHVEDETVDQMLLVHSMKKLGLSYRVEAANDGEEALALLRDPVRFEELSPVVVLLDLNMPRLDGIGFLRAVRDDPALKKTVVFVVTTSSRQEDLDAVYDLGAAGYVVKDPAGFLGLAGLLDHFVRTVSLPTVAA